MTDNKLLVFLLATVLLAESWHWSAFAQSNDEPNERSILAPRDTSASANARSPQRSQPHTEEIPAPDSAATQAPAELPTDSNVGNGQNAGAQPNRIADSYNRLLQDLERLPTGAGCKEYLALPSSLLETTDPPAADSSKVDSTSADLNAAFVRYEKVHRDAEYRMIASLQSFQETRYWLATALGLEETPPAYRNAPGGVYFGRNAAVQFGGGAGARFGGPSGVQFGGGQGARFGNAVQFGGGQGVRIGRFRIGR